MLASFRIQMRILQSLAIRRNAYSTRLVKESNLASKKCIITGASRGIGEAIARRFAEEGAICILVGRHESTLADVASKLHQTETGNDDHVHHIVTGAVEDRRLWDTIAKEHKVVDVLVNAAGISHASLLMATKPELVNQVIQTNLMGTIWGCQIIAKNMIRRKGGSIVNVSSLLGIKGGEGSTVYAASKAGILGLTRSLAAEVGSRGVRVNAIVPGYVETQMTDAMDASARSKALDAIPLKRFGDASEIADAALFLATNAYANNCVLNLDGGLSAI